MGGNGPLWRNTTLRPEVPARSVTLLCVFRKRSHPFRWLRHPEQARVVPQSRDVNEPVQETIMANNFTDSFPANLIGLWDFRVGNEPDDTGLDDGFAQNGVFIDGAQALADQLVLDGFVEQQFDVNGNDAPFDLSAGTLITEFTQFGNTGVTFQTVVNRGTYWHGADDGYFEIHVTETGAVEVTHNFG